ncbi:hypothetical protein RISK_000649 [Rhodopirellula islandica]|uniref:Uncharacterized protein n=1 Tax=Rhodopirellula islandica TaxID=595434 RepID=A0A0J1BM04_RHOIS|nr:hypothetical protein RISK_000649 [Rhodopirellula islandica]
MSGETLSERDGHDQSRRSPDWITIGTPDLDADGGIALVVAGMDGIQILFHQRKPPSSRAS